MASKEQSDDLQEACGLFGCLAKGEWPTNLDVSHVIYFGLIALQHRGQEGAGITTSNGDSSHMFTHKITGLISQGFKEDDLQKLKGNLGIGHTRYSTLGGTDIVNIQPFVIHTKHGLLSVAHNGELVNAHILRKKILEQGVGLSTGSDSELITQILAMPPPGGEPDGPNWPARILHLMSLTGTAYSLLVMHGETIYAVRDPFGNRPLCLGKLLPPHCSQGVQICNNTECEGYVVSSESCSFSSVSGHLLREVQAGEIVEITKSGGFRSVCIINRPDNKAPAFCIFEYVYFASADSIIEGQQVYTVRKECGRQLALEAPVDADIVSCVPESATPAAYGFSMQSGIPYVEVLLKNRYIGRTFIEPSTKLRQQAVVKKFRPITENFRGKRIILIDDSIVRGNTIGGIVHLLKGSGAKEVHIRIASPPLHFPCYMGINIPTKEELIANECSEKELATKLNVESLVHLSVEGLESAVRKNLHLNNGTKIGHCTACLTGNYPVELEW